MKSILSIVLIAIGLSLSAQTTMNIYQNNGTVMNLPIATIDSSTFTISPPPAKLNIHQSGGGVISIIVSNIDSITYTVSNNNLPILITKPISNIDSVSATSGGNIVSNGGNSVTQSVIERGVVWSTSHNPTITNNSTVEAGGAGSFTSRLTNLVPNTTYYVRAYATNTNGTAYGNEVSFTTKTAVFSIGDTYQGGIIFYLDGNGGGLIAAPNDQAISREWGCIPPYLIGTSTTFGSGYQNTYTVIDTCNMPLNTGVAVAMCANYSLNGYRGWYLPSKDELDLMRQNIFLGSNIGGFRINASYWSSSEVFGIGTNSAVWTIQFSNGSWNHSVKFDRWTARAIRAF